MTHKLKRPLLGWNTSYQMITIAFISAILGVLLMAGGYAVGKDAVCKTVNETPLRMAQCE